MMDTENVAAVEVTQTLILSLAGFVMDIMLWATENVLVVATVCVVEGMPCEILFNRIDNPKSPVMLLIPTRRTVTK